MAVDCSRCSGRIDELTDGRVPAWCPRCGADLRKSPVPEPAPDADVPYGAPSTAVAVAPAPARSGTIPRPSKAVRERPAAFDQSRALAVYEFSLEGYLHKVGPAILLVAIFASLAALGMGIAVSRPGAGATLPALLMAGLAVAFVFPVFLRYGKCIRRVEIFAAGIRWQGPEGTDRLAWADVEEVYRSEIIFNGFRTSELKLLGAGKEVAFDLALERFAEFATLVQERCAEVMRPRKLEEAGEGGARFGPVLIGPAGVSLDGWRVPWESIKRYAVTGGRLTIHTQGIGSKSIPLLGIPNYLVLLYLMGEFAPATVRRASGRPAPAD